MTGFAKSVSGAVLRPALHPRSGVVPGQSLAKGRRVLLIYGGMHLLHAPHGRTLTRFIEQETGARAYVIVPLTPLATDPGGVFPRLAACPAAPSSRPRAPGSEKSAPATSCPARRHR
jgi:hypothetical protein